MLFVQRYLPWLKYAELSIFIYVNETYKEIDFFSFKNKYEELDEINFYINNPFCFKNCKFCFFKGKIYNKEEFDKFYYDYLPERIASFYDLMDKKGSSYYFGGGTPNSMSPEVMRHVFDLFPKNFKNVPKAIELHPAYLKKSHIDVIKEYNFNYASYCIQTFDEAVLKKHNRDGKDVGAVKEDIDYIKSRGIYTNIDLIVFVEEDNWKDVLKKDLSICFLLQPDNFTISVDKNNYDMLDIDEYIEVLLSFSKITNYKIIGEVEVVEYKNLDNEEILKDFINTYCKTVNMFKEEIDIDAFYRDVLPQYYTMMEVDSVETNRGLIAIGDLLTKRKNNYIYSTIGQMFQGIEVNENFCPKYYIQYDNESGIEFYIKEFYLFLEKKKIKVPNRIKISFEKIIKSNSINNVVDFFDFVEVNIAYDVKYKDDRAQEFIEKSQNLVLEFKDYFYEKYQKNI